MIRPFVKAGFQRLGLYERASRTWIWLEPVLVNTVRALTRQNERLVRRYLESHATPKLHIGCGGNELSGWLNTELCPHGEQIYLDATKPFPFRKGVFAFVYTEHMIEHISAPDAEAMLKECFRVMRARAVVRVVTPNLLFLTKLLESPPTTAVVDYIRHSISANHLQTPTLDGVAVFNNFVRAWGHRFIHDESSLRALMARAGFEDIRSWPLNESRYPELTRLAKIDRMPDGFLDMESFVLEGRKPAGRG